MEGVGVMARRQKVSEYIKNMPTSRMIDTPPELINDTNQSDLSHIVSRMSSVANKRLKAMEEKGILYSNSEYPDAIAGVRKFGAAGKTLGQLRSEFKRLHGFLNSAMSTLTGRAKSYYEAKKRVAEKQGREFNETFNQAKKEYYSDKKLRQSFDDIGSMFAEMRTGNWIARYGLAGLDSKQIKELFEEVALEHGQPEYDLDNDSWREMVDDAKNRLISLVNEKNDYEDDYFGGASVSDFF